MANQILSDDSGLLVENTEDKLELSVVIPTYNEIENVPILLNLLFEVLKSKSYEIIIVDDNSPDGTWQAVESISKQHPQVKLIRRLEGKGLSSAVIAGMHFSKGACIAVMDADMQHDESILPQMCDKVISERVDICVGSREAPGGGYGDWSLKRKLVSYGARWLAHVSVGTTIKDPMSGFFALSREYFESTIEKINPAGFKILLEFLARGDKPNAVEVGYTFRTRVHGTTKLNATVALEYLLALIDLRFGWLVPNQFVKFGLVGLTGSLVNFIGFALMKSAGFPIPISIVLGVELAIMWTYFANNKFTFTPMSFTGKQFFKGFALYQFVCLYGLIIQISVVSTLVTTFSIVTSNIVGLYLVYMVGVAFAAVGNYFLHSYYTWNRLGYAFYRPRKTSVTTKLSTELQ